MLCPFSSLGFSLALGFSLGCASDAATSMASSVHSAPFERAVGAAALSDDPSTRAHAIRGANVLPSSRASSTQAIDHMILALHHSSSTNIDAKPPPERYHRLLGKKAKKDKARRDAKKEVLSLIHI